MQRTGADNRHGGDCNCNGIIYTFVTAALQLSVILRRLCFVEGVASVKARPFSFRSCMMIYLQLQFMFGLRVVKRRRLTVALPSFWLKVVTQRVHLRVLVLRASTLS